MKYVKLFESFLNETDLEAKAEKLWNSSTEDDRLEMLDTDDEDQYQAGGIYSKQKWDELPPNVKQTILKLANEK